MRRQRVSGDRSSLFPILIGVGVIIVGFVLMRLIMNIQRISPHEMVGVPQPTAAQLAEPQAPGPQAAPPQARAQGQGPQQQNVQSRAPAASASVGQAPSPPPATVAEAPKKSAPPVANAAPSIAPPAATTAPAFASANAAAEASAAPTKEPEVRRAEPVRPEDLAKAEATQKSQKTAAAQGPNQVAIKPLKKTYIKVVVDNESLQPAFERWISPADGTVEFSGQKIAVRVLDRDAIQIKKNGKPIASGDEDVTVE